MDFLYQTMRGLKDRFFKKEQHEYVECSRMDAYLNAAYKVLIWEDPAVSWMTLGVLHVLFWVIMQLELRLYSIIFLSILMALLCDIYFERQSLRAPRNISSDTMRHIINIINNTVIHFRILRKDNPSFFCITMCGIFLGLTVIARNVSGYMLMYCLLLGIFFGPLLISKLPPEYMSNIKQVVRTLSNNEEMVAESELLPFILDKDLNERDPDLDSLLTDRTADSMTSFISGITSMPSHLDAEGSLDDLEEDDLDLAVPAKSSSVSYTPGEISSDSDSEQKHMNFESSHFNGDSSSEEENYYIRGLQFTDAVDSPNPSTEKIKNLPLDPVAVVSAGILGNLQSLGSNLLSNVLRTTVTANTPKRNDSDSDFEIINTDEADDS